MNSAAFFSFPVITRFAPSPTGKMTLGNYRTALWAYLFALKAQGQFILRIEDTDRERSQPEYVEALFADLKAMGLAFDPNLVWYQSERSAIYNAYSEELNKKGLVYECFCTQEELALERKIQLAQKTPPRYSGKCRYLSASQKAFLQDSGRHSVLRFCVIEPKVEFTDIILGDKVFFGHDIGDFVIRKSDGEPTFFFCNAIDDALAGVTHALRGEDHLTNTPRQLALIDALDLKRPAYGHLPLILGNDHKPLSKRNGSISISDFLQKGYYPEAINNYCARLGHYIAQKDLMSLEDLAKIFDIKMLSSSAAHFDTTQLDYWQKRAFDSQPHSIHRDLIAQYAPMVTDPAAFLSLTQPHVSLGSEFEEWGIRLHELSTDLVDPKNFAFQDYGWNRDWIEELATHCEEPWAQWIARAQAHAITGRNLFFPLRYLFTGLSDGPKLEPLYNYIDKKLLKNRLLKGLS